MIFEMRLAEGPFGKIKSGEKTVEIRLFDVKRQKISVGDKIVFCREGGEERICAAVVALHRFDTFKSLFLSDLFPQTGSNGLTAEQAAEGMYAYYSQGQEQKWGVLGIEIRVEDIK